MVKKSIYVLATSALLFSLSACNNNTDTAFDNTRDNGTINVRNNGNNDDLFDDNRANRNNLNLTNNERDNGTMNVRNNGNNDDFFDGNRANRNDLNTRNVRYNNQLNDFYDGDRANRNELNSRNMANNENNLNNFGLTGISADTTSLSSDKFPHTKAVLIQDAQYDMIRANPEEAAELQKKIEQELKQRIGQITGPMQGQEQGKGQAPAQPQTPAPAPQPKEQTPAKQQTPQTQQPQEKPTGNISQYAQEVINLTNKERTKAGLPALTADTQLSSVAQKKSQDMQQNNYFSHTSPTYGSPFDMMRDFGVTYKSAGENIAQGQRTPQEVVQSWMNSPGHKQNIMSKSFTHIGVGYEQGGNHWTQMFIGK